MRTISFNVFTGKGTSMEVREKKLLVVRIDAEVLRDMKKRAIDHGMTLRAWLMQAVVERIARENRAK